MDLPVLSDVIECSCDDCVSACVKKPGWFLPEEIKPAADLMGLSEEEFFNKYLSIDWWGNPEENLFLLAPATDNSEPGKEYPLDPTGRCVFLTQDKKCQIHAAKPFECRQFDHRKENNTKQHQSVAKAWIPYKNYIEKLLGRPPNVNEDPEQIILFLMKMMMGEI